MAKRRVKGILNEYKQSKNPRRYTKTIDTKYILRFNYNINYLGKNFMFRPSSINKLIEDM